MKKQLKVTLATGAALLAVAGIANAAPLQFNLVGASAQFDYWAGGSTPSAPKFLRDKLGCTAPDANLKVTGKFAYIKGTGCNPALVPATYNNEIEFRITGQATVEATAINGTPSQYPSVVYISADPTLPCNDTHKRSFNKGDNTLACYTAHVGAMDLDASSVTQISSGQLYGPMGGGAVSFDHTGGLNVAGMTHLNAGGDTFAVPFGLFVNNAVKARHCISSTPKAGDICSADSDCGNATPAAGDCNATSTTINNLSRLQVAMIFSGQTASWRDFGPAYDDIETVACLRHAGSGTAATFDNMVMTAGTTGWGATTATAESSSAPVIYFNDTTDTELACINGNTVYPIVAGGGAAIGAVGYADADKGISATTKGQENLKKIKYNGMWPTADNIKNGTYDWYSIASFYTNPANTPQNVIAAQMLDYVQNGTIPATKAAYWAQTKDMVFKRGGDLGYPVRQ